MVQIAILKHVGRRVQQHIRRTKTLEPRAGDRLGRRKKFFGFRVKPACDRQYVVMNIQYGAAGKNTTVKNSLKEGYPAWSFMGETTYRVGLNAKF